MSLRIGKKRNEFWNKYKDAVPIGLTFSAFII